LGRALDVARRLVVRPQRAQQQHRRVLGPLVDQAERRRHLLVQALQRQLVGHQETQLSRRIREPGEVARSASYGDSAINTGERRPCANAIFCGVMITAVWIGWRWSVVPGRLALGCWRAVGRRRGGSRREAGGCWLGHVFL
jgi:hypothetical protein